MDKEMCTSHTDVQSNLFHVLLEPNPHGRCHLSHSSYHRCLQTRQSRHGSPWCRHREHSGQRSLHLYTETLGRSAPLKHSQNEMIFSQMTKLLYAINIYINTFYVHVIWIIFIAHCSKNSISYWTSSSSLSRVDSVLIFGV